jgi:hypothetical protein
MKMTVSARVGCGILLFIALCVIWYSVASNYDYSALAGTYVFHRNGESCTLYLRPDQTFVQELSRSGEIQRSQGRWHRYGESHVSFSDEFLKVSGEKMNAAGQTHGEFDKWLGMFPTLVLAPLPDGPKFRKKLFR